MLFVFITKLINFSLSWLFILPEKYILTTYNPVDVNLLNQELLDNNNISLKYIFEKTENGVLTLLNNGTSTTNYSFINDIPYGKLDVLIIGGGGGGGRWHGAGGGGGGLVLIQNYEMELNDYLKIQVGNGGSGFGNHSYGQPGFDSIISLNNNENEFIAMGGGGGDADSRGYTGYSRNGGSGGGGRSWGGGASRGISIQEEYLFEDIRRGYGNKGGAGGQYSGGGGAGGNGGRNGGSGLAEVNGIDFKTYFNITDENIGEHHTNDKVYFSGGGSTLGTGGIGGGGDGGYGHPHHPNADNGKPNTGGGGGGQISGHRTSGNGGSGVVFIKLRFPETILDERMYFGSGGKGTGIYNYINFNKAEELLNSDLYSKNYAIYEYNSENDNGFGQTEYNLNVPVEINCDILVIAGGGGGGGNGGGGGGAGGLLYFNNIDLLGNYNMKVGKGAEKNTNVTPIGQNGYNTEIYFNNTNNIVYGGGGGGTWDKLPSGSDGGSGGGAGSHRINVRGEGIAGQGNHGGYSHNTPADNGSHAGGGGGGAGTPGTNANVPVGHIGNGGDGLKFNLTGQEEYYAGGGGGAFYRGTNLGGGYNGLGQDNYGGGGKSFGGIVGEAGKNGVIIIRINSYKLNNIDFYRTIEKLKINISNNNSGTGGSGEIVNGKSGDGSNGLVLLKVKNTGYNMDKYVLPRYLLEVDDFIFTDKVINNPIDTNLLNEELRNSTNVSLKYAFEKTENNVLALLNDGSDITEYSFINDIPDGKYDVLIVGGGGGGGRYFGGGGGAGGLVFIQNYNVELNDIINVQVGDGGDGNPNTLWYHDKRGGKSGYDSFIKKGDNTNEFIAKGGGGGGVWYGTEYGSNGGSGGGSGGNGTGIGLSTQDTYVLDEIKKGFGNNGSTSTQNGGGGGAGSAGSGSSGGVGLAEVDEINFKIDFYLTDQNYV